MSIPQRNREARAPRREREELNRELARVSLLASLPGRIERTEPEPDVTLKKIYSTQTRTYKRKRKGKSR